MKASALAAIGIVPGGAVAATDKEIEYAGPKADDVPWFLVVGVACELAGVDATDASSGCVPLRGEIAD